MRAQRIFRRHFWTVPLLLGTAATFFTLRAFYVGLGMALARNAEVQGPRVPASDPRPHRASKDAKSILARNPFDHLLGPLDEEAPKPPANPSDPTLDPECDDVTVVAIVAGPAPAASFAALATREASGKTVLRRPGDEVAGKRVEYIRWDRLWLSEGATRCQAPLVRAKNLQSDVAFVPAAAPSPFAKGVKKIGPREYDIDRSTLESVLGSQGSVFRGTRLHRQMQEERIRGMKVTGLMPESVLSLIGIQNGDELRSINGFDLGDPSKLVEAYARLVTAERLSLVLVRNGQELTFDYNVK